MLENAATNRRHVLAMNVKIFLAAAFYMSAPSATAFLVSNPLSLLSRGAPSPHSLESYHRSHGFPLLAKHGLRAGRAGVSSLTMNKARGFVIEPAGKSDSGTGWNLYQQSAQGVIAIGNRKARRVFQNSVQLGNTFASPNLMSRQQKLNNLLFDLKEEHRLLDKEVTELTRSYVAPEVLKRHKKMKLAMKDRILAIEAALTHKPSAEEAPKLLGEGSSGTVLLGRDLTKGDEVAIKVESVREDGESLLERENFIMHHLRGLTGFIQPRFFGRQEVMGKDNFVLVMDMLGPSLEDLWWATTGGSGGFSPETVINLADQMICLLRSMHQRGYLHRDIKPDNFLMSSKAKGSQLHLIDMGVARRFVQPESKQHIPPQKNLPFVGTCRYAGVHAHEGVEQGRRDDMEAMVYTIAFLLRGELPWDQRGVVDAELYLKVVGKSKRRVLDSIPSSPGADLEEVAEDVSLCQDLPPELQEMLVKLLLEVKKTKFEQEPDYEKMRAILRMALFRLTGNTDIGKSYADYDWMSAGVSWSGGTISFKKQ